MKTNLQSTRANGKPAMFLVIATCCVILLLLLAINANAAPDSNQAQRCSDSNDRYFLSIVGANQQITAKAEDFTSYWIGTKEGLWIINKQTARVKHLMQGSVLPSNRVTAICVTPDENVYVGTDKGIFRFDGYSYMIVSTENSGLPTDDITSMTSDNDGNLWIGTKDKGLVEMNNYKCKIFNTKNSVLTDNKVWNVTHDEGGNISITLANQSRVKITANGLENFSNELAQKEK